MTEQISFLSAVQNGDVETVKVYLNPPNSRGEGQLNQNESDDETSDNIPKMNFMETIQLKPTSSEYEVLYCRSKGEMYSSAALNLTEVTRFDDQVDELEKEYADLQSPSTTCISLLTWIEAVYIAFNKSHIDILSFLLNDEQFTGAVTEDGETVLDLAIEEYFASDCQSEAIKRIEVLLKCGRCVVNVLHFVREEDFRPTDDQLLSSDDINFDMYGLIELLLKYEVNLDEEFLTAVENGQLWVVKAILDNVTDEYKSLMDPWTKVFYYETKYSVSIACWKEAMLIADDKNDYKILKHLLNYDPVVQGVYSEGGSIIHELMHTGEDDNFRVHLTPENLRLIQLLVESGRIGTNAMDFEAKTVLHCLCYCFEDDYDLIVKATMLFLQQSMNICLQKDNKGQTPLMIASANGRSSILRTILNWAKMTRTWLDIDAQDFYGLTALMKAAKWKHADAVEMLLGAGATPNVSDNRGFTALHYALHETPSPETWINFGEFPSNIEELEKRKRTKVILFQTEEPYRRYIRSRSRLNNDQMKTVKLLLMKDKTDINALDCEGYSPLDIAEASIPEIHFSITDVLKSRGAILNTFQHKDEHHRNGDKNFTCENFLHRLVVDANFYRPYRSLSFNFTEETKSELFDPSPRNEIFDEELARRNFSQLGAITQRQLVEDRDQKGRTPLLCAIVSRKARDSCYEANSLVEMLLMFGCSVNETDVYGRSPLHYADNKELNQSINKTSIAPF